MSDFGLDAYVLDGDDAVGHPHPLEIARDLIAAGKPRSALEVLSLHHGQLADDPKYLLICSEAWWATGDALRAQQALVGAARLVPDDPAPLQLLGELLRECGEQEKAERVLAKARALELSGAVGADLRESELPTVEDDLIAFAERRERSKHAGLTPRQILGALSGLALTAGVVAGIVVLTQPSEETETAPRPETASAPEAARASAPVSVPAPAAESA
ncbi:MAG: hypothetical protein WBM47_11190, partial [Polyangiales bacterium]